MSAEPVFLSDSSLVHPRGLYENPSVSNTVSLTELNNTRSSQSVPPWMPDILARLRDMSAWPDGWDGFGAARPGDKQIRRAEELLSLRSWASCPPPYVGATSSGDVVIAWNTKNLEIDLEITLNSVEVSITDLSRSFVWEGEADKVPEGGLEYWIARISLR